MLSLHCYICLIGNNDSLTIQNNFLTQYVITQQENSRNTELRGKEGGVGGHGEGVLMLSLSFSSTGKNLWLRPLALSLKVSSQKKQVVTVRIRQRCEPSSVQQYLDLALAVSS